MISYRNAKTKQLLFTYNFKKFLSLVALLVLPGAITTALGQSPATGLITTNNAGNGSANSGSFSASVSADGRFVAFVSAATNLVPNDTNGRDDVFVRDRQTGQTKMVSINFAGTGGGDQHSSTPTITPDGRYVVFSTSSSNLVADDPTTLLYGAIFVRDLQLNVTKLVTRNFTGDRRANGTSGWNEPLAISANGRFIAFNSSSTDLVANDTNNHRDIFVRDMQTSTTTLVSTGRDGSADIDNDTNGPVMTPDGRYIAFRSSVTIYVRDLQAGTTEMVSVNRFGTGNGNRPSDDGASTNLAISADGRFVAFVSSATDLVENDNNPGPDVFVRDTQSNTTSLVSVDVTGVSTGNALSGGLAMTPDGRFVAFVSGATNLVSANDTNDKQDVFLRDLTAHTTTLISINLQGAAGGTGGVALSGSFDRPAISADGRYVSFTSNASDLTAISDTNHTNGGLGNDVFVRDTQAGMTKLVSINNAGLASGDGTSGSSIMTPDGRYIVYASSSSDLVAHDTNNNFDLFTFINIPQPGQLQFLTAVTRANENSATATITVTIVNGATAPVSVDYTTLNGTAAAGSDYVAATGTLSFMPGETSKTFSIQILDDSSDEDDEKVIIKLSNPTINAQLGEPGVAALSITDDDPPPTVTIDDVNVSEGDAGTSNANFSVSLSSPSGKTITLNFATADGSAKAGSDYAGGAGVITFSPGVTTRSLLIPVIGEVVRESDETFSVTITNPINVTITKGQGIGTIIDNDSSQANTLQFNRSTETVGEWGGYVSLQVDRFDSTSAATVNYATSDASGLNACSSVTGLASSRCDYATTIGTLRFAVGESSKTIYIPIIDDNFTDANETFTVTLSNPSGASLGSISSATITIIDNPNGPVNPVDLTAFFVRQHYIDFLGREPDPSGNIGWQSILNTCPPSGKDANGNYCDRIEVSSAFFRSEEFQNKAYFVYRFYSAVGKIPLYETFMPDFARVSGFLSTEELEANKVAFINEFMTRPDYQTLYGSIAGNDAYVTALLNTLGLPDHPGKQGWINALNSGTTRAVVLRAMTESGEVYQKYYTEAFVIMQYFGYLRRSADISYLSWIQTMNSSGGDYRQMINGFLNSAEYRSRFGN